jgi:hypothetical protein
VGNKGHQGVLVRFELVEKPKLGVREGCGVICGDSHCSVEGVEEKGLDGVVWVERNDMSDDTIDDDVE